MTENVPTRGSDNWSVALSRLIESQTSLIESLYAQSQAGRWGVPRERFAAALERSAKKGLASGAVTSPQLEAYFSALHLEDLGLATACSGGSEAAWEHFLSTYRAYLRAGAS